MTARQARNHTGTGAQDSLINRDGHFRRRSGNARRTSAIQEKTEKRIRK